MGNEQEPDGLITARGRPISLKWKWTIGACLGAFLVFIVFAWFIVTAFSNQMLKTERESLRTSLQTVTNRFKPLDETSLHLDEINAILRPDTRNFNAFVDDPVVKEIAKDDYAVRIFNRQGEQVYPKVANGAPFKSVDQPTIQLENVRHNDWLVGRAPIFNQRHRLLGYVLVENHLTDFHKTFTRVYLIILVSMILGIMALGLWAYWLADFLLRPVKAMAQVANHLHENPSSPDRVKIVASHPDELSDLARLLNTMLDRMQRFIQQQQQFVEDVSHELRTPVAIVKGHMELLDRWGKDDPKILNESISASLKEMQRMQGLIQEMLDLTRADQVELTFKDGNTDVKELVNAIFNNYRLIYPDFTFVIDDDLKGPTWVNMSRDHLEQILIILSDNAIKYSQERKEIHFASSRSGQKVEIAIQDFGEGISPEDATRVFDRFYRVDKARSRKQGGNGLGLSIAQKLIEGYGGQITLESVLGQGSIFRITLPIKESSTH